MGSDYNPGCCVDNHCSDETCMKLPQGMTCGDCAHKFRCLAMGFTDSEQDTTCSFYPRRFHESPWLEFNDPETDSKLLVAKNENTITLCDADDAYEFDDLDKAIEHARSHLLSEVEMQWRAHYGDELYDWLEMRHYLAEGWLRIIEELELMIVQVATIALFVRRRSDLSCASN